MVCTSLQFLNKDSISIRPQQQEVLLHILSGHDTFINLPTGSVSLLPLHFSIVVNIHLPHFLLQPFIISYHLQFACRQYTQLPVTGTANYSSPSWYLVTFHYTGTEEHQEVNETDPALLTIDRSLDQWERNKAEYETDIASYLAFALAASESTFACCNLHYVNCG